MPRIAIPLSDLKCRTARPRDRAYKLFDGGGMYLYVAPVVRRLGGCGISNQTARKAR